MIVMKFGGSSVESAEAIERVAGIVRARVDRHPIVVVSAMGKTTNKLLAIAQSAIKGKRDEFIRQLHDLRDFHSREARQVVPLSHRAELDRTLDDHFQEMTELVKGIAVLGELTPRSIDAISSYGERLSSYIVALAFEYYGVPSVHFDSRRVIITDHRHTQAAPLYTDTYKRLADTLPALAQSKVVVMGGFIGSTEEGVTTTSPAAAAPTSPHRSWARGCRPKKSRSGPMWMACSRLTRRSFPAGIASRRSPLPRPRNWPTSARRCFILRRSFRQLNATFRC